MNVPFLAHQGRGDGGSRRGGVVASARGPGGEVRYGGVRAGQAGDGVGGSRCGRARSRTGGQVLAVRTRFDHARHHAPQCHCGYAASRSRRPQRPAWSRGMPRAVQETQEQWRAWLPGAGPSPLGSARPCGRGREPRRCRRASRRRASGRRGSRRRGSPRRPTADPVPARPPPSKSRHSGCVLATRAAVSHVRPATLRPLGTAGRRR